MAEITQDRRDRAALMGAHCQALAMELDLEAMEHLLADNPGPRFYIESQRALLDFARRCRRIQQEHGRERIKLQVAPFISGVKDLQ